ncbi:MAG: hypothetical protein H7Z21_05955 [Hymenobacter sp.]|nr:hypothetical protein [Hymenobacter sp.]
MKAPALFRLFLVLSLSLITTLATARKQPARPALPGYWNLETNLTTRAYTIVRFYNGQDELVYEERLDNLCLDLGKNTGLCRRTTRRLNVALQQKLRTPAPTTPMPTLAAQLSQDRRVQRVYATR